MLFCGICAGIRLFLDDAQDAKNGFQASDLDRPVMLAPGRIRLFLDDAQDAKNGFQASGLDRPVMLAPGRITSMSSARVEHCMYQPTSLKPLLGSGKGFAGDKAGYVLDHVVVEFASWRSASINGS